MNKIGPSSAIRRSLIAGIASAYALSFGTFGAAADEIGVPKVTIRYGDLDLATLKGAKVLYERIVSAAYSACAPFGIDSRDNADPWALETCRNKIIADAVAKIGKPALYALYNAKNPKSARAPILTAEGRK